MKMPSVAAYIAVSLPYEDDLGNLEQTTQMMKNVRNLVRVTISAVSNISYNRSTIYLEVHPEDLVLFPI